MGNPQNEPTPIQKYNSTAMGIVNNTIKQSRSKAMDMRFHCVRDRTTQENILVYWIPGNTNLAYCHTKFHSPDHHQKQRPLHVHTDESLKCIPETQRLDL